MTERNVRFTIGTEKTDEEKYLVFNNLSQDIFGEYDGEFKNHKYNFASAIDFRCKEKLLDTGKVNRFKKSASELNNVLTQKNNYDTREKIFNTANKARIVYLDLMNVLKEISDGLKGKQIKPDQKILKNLKLCEQK